MQLQQWTALNKQLLDEWRQLLSSEPELSPASSAPAPAIASAPSAIAAYCLQYSDDIFCIFETGHGCTWLSPSWQRITGQPTESSLREGFYRQLHPEHVKPFITALQEAICGETPVSGQPEQEFLLLTRNGQPRWHALHIARISNAQDGLQQVTCRLRDVQALHDAQEATRQAKRETERALQSRSEFLNGMSHELRTPLNAILGFTQIMEAGMYGEIANSHYNEYLRHIRESSYELLAQIDDLMDIACIDSGAMHLARERCDLAELLIQAVAMHRQQAMAVQVNLTCGVRPGFAVLLADRVKLQHCINHIVANGVKHGRPGGKVTIDASFTLDGELCIAVEDNGTGMSARKLQSMVTALQRDDSWTARNTNGLGLGLPLAKEFAQLHGGYLTLDSKAGEGTRVCILLPPDCLEKPAPARPLARSVLVD